MGRPTYAKKQALKSDLNGNLSRTMKKEVRDIKTEVIVKNHSLVEMEILKVTFRKEFVLLDSEPRDTSALTAAKS